MLNESSNFWKFILCLETSVYFLKMLAKWKVSSIVALGMVGARGNICIWGRATDWTHFEIIVETVSTQKIKRISLPKTPLRLELFLWISIKHHKERNNFDTLHYHFHETSGENPYDWEAIGGKTIKTYQMFWTCWAWELWVLVLYFMKLKYSKAMIALSHGEYNQTQAWVLLVLSTTSVRSFEGFVISTKFIFFFFKAKENYKSW